MNTARREDTGSIEDDDDAIMDSYVERVLFRMKIHMDRDHKVSIRAKAEVSEFMTRFVKHKKWRL